MRHVEEGAARLHSGVEQWDGGQRDDLGIFHVAEVHGLEYPAGPKVE